MKIQHERRCSLLIAVLVALTAGAWPAPARAATDLQDPNEVVASALAQTPEQQEATRQYWTANNSRNMREAVVLTMPVFAGAEKPAAPGRAPAAAAAGGPTWIVSGTAGGRKAMPHVQILPQRAAPAAGAAIGPMAGVMPFSFTRYRLFPDSEAVYRTYPYRAVGKLFFNVGAGRFSCTASVVAAFNFSTVWTSGHCVFTPGFGFHTNFLFVPAQRRVGVTPTAPFGNWTGFSAVTLLGWTTGLLEFDHGVVVMNRGGSGPAPEFVGVSVGMLGFMANAPRRQTWHVLAYPQDPHSPPSATPQFTGFHQEICAAAWAADDQPTGNPATDPPTVGIGCDMTTGSSGGPWIVDFNSQAVATSGGVPVALNLVNGNISYRYPGGPPNSQRLYSPYFAMGAVALREFAENVSIP